jgi:hypothetical protein
MKLRKKSAGPGHYKIYHCLLNYLIDRNDEGEDQEKKFHATARLLFQKLHDAKAKRDERYGLKKVPRGRAQEDVRANIHEEEVENEDRTEDLIEFRDNEKPEKRKIPNNCRESSRPGANVI